MHMLGAGLALALDLGRVLLSNPDGPLTEKLRSNAWQTQNPHCFSQNTSTLECYYEPWSNCSAQQALGPPQMVSDHVSAFRSLLSRYPHIWQLDDGNYSLSYPGQVNSSDRGFIFGDVPSALEHTLQSHRTVILIHRQFRQLSAVLIPRPVRPLLRCSPVLPSRAFYWWRAISITVRGDIHSSFRIQTITLLVLCVYSGIYCC
mmetsp:Transcript_25713/g.25940  ORF Transcript_25713/g.25940 Transcript_25713/m.25940 type:complete len:203 (-) Transcript_25713:985-1593(-)